MEKMNQLLQNSLVTRLMAFAVLIQAILARHSFMEPQNVSSTDIPVKCCFWSQTTSCASVPLGCVSGTDPTPASLLFENTNSPSRGFYTQEIYTTGWLWAAYEKYVEISEKSGAGYFSLARPACTAVSSSYMDIYFEVSRGSFARVGAYQCLWFMLDHCVSRNSLMCIIMLYVR